MAWCSYRFQRLDSKEKEAKKQARTSDLIYIIKGLMHGHVFSRVSATCMIFYVHEDVIYIMQLYIEQYTGWQLHHKAGTHFVKTWMTDKLIDMFDYNNGNSWKCDKWVHYVGIQIWNILKLYILFVTISISHERMNNGESMYWFFMHD